jgi:citrate lyase subunit beta/citryl-CoA lyase
MAPVLDPSFLLFVPGDRPDRFDRALLGGTTGAILDLEDAVAVERKLMARAAVAGYLGGAQTMRAVAVRVNAEGSPWFEDDLSMLRGRTIAAIVVPKAEAPETLERISSALGDPGCIAILESARGILAAERIAAHRCCIALAFGPYDHAANLGGVSDWDVMLPYRAAMLVAARAHGKAAIDGPSTILRERSPVFDEARHVARLGYDGKLLVHPDQIAVVRSAFRPTSDEFARAQRILEAGSRSMPAVVDGTMIDEPMLAAARRVVSRAEGTAQA